MAHDNHYLLMWCCEGLEYAVEVGALERQNLMADLKGTKRVTVPNLNAMMMRARFNPQRHYEIYTITTTPDITIDDVKNGFNEEPQYWAELIRERGNKLYSDRATQTNKII